MSSFKKKALAFNLLVFLAKNSECDSSPSLSSIDELGADISYRCYLDVPCMYVTK